MADRRPVVVDASRVFDRLPPHDLAAEMATLGAMLLAPDRASDIVELLASADDFYLDDHRSVYRAILKSLDGRSTVDLVTLCAELREQGRDVVDGEGKPGSLDVGYLEKLVASVPSAASGLHYGEIVASLAKRRRFAEICADGAWQATTAPSSDPAAADALIDATAERLSRLGDRAAGSSIKAASDIVRDRLAQLDRDDDDTIPTGLRVLDAQLGGGLRPGELSIIAARPSMGKTALALNIGEHIAQHCGPTFVASLEMSAGSLIDRIIAGRAGVPVGSLRRARSLDADTYRRVLGVADAVAKLPLQIVDESSLTLARLRQHARRAAVDARREGAPLQAIIVDYLQLLTCPGSDRERRDLEIGAISRGLKALARELSVPVVCLSQLNRASERREGNKPRMSDLRESGSIEQDADVVILLHREDYYGLGTPGWLDANADRVGVAELIVAKQRNGPTGPVDVRWDAERCRFADLHERNPFQ